MKEQGAKWRKELALSASLVLLTAIAYGFLFQSDTFPYSRYSDIVALHLGVKETAHDSWQAGHGLPLWRSDQLSGGPALTHPQALYTNPFQALFLLIEPTAAAGPTLWIHFVVMAFSMSVLGAALGLSYRARAFMAIAGLFSFKLILITYAGWLPVIPVVSATPLFIAALLRMLDRPTLGSTLLLSLATGLCLHSGHLQIFYYAALLITPYAVVRIAADMRQGQRIRARRVICGSILAAILGASVTAYLLVPLAAEATLTTRVDASYEFLISRQAYSTRNFLTLLNPEILGTPIDGSYPQIELWEDVAYFGIIAEIMALVGAVLAWRRRYTRFLVAAVAASLLLSLDTPLTRLFFEFVPGFDLFRNPSRFLFLTTLFGLPLAGIGLDATWDRLRATNLRRSFGWGITTLVIAGTAAEGAYYARRYLDVQPVDHVFPETQYSRFFATDTSSFRIAPLKRFTINYGWAAPMSLELVTGFEPYNFEHYQQYMSLMTRGVTSTESAPVWTDVPRIARFDLLDALNVKYIVSSQPLAAVPQPLERIAEFRDEPVFLFYRGFARANLTVYENRNVRGRAHWAAQVLPASDAAAALELVQTHNLSDVTVVQDIGSVIEAEPRHPGDRIEIVEVRGGHLTVDCDSEHSRLLVLSEIWHPGWRATVDRKQAQVYRTNLTLMSVQVPAGRHRIELDFYPLYWELSLGITLVAWIALALLAGRWWIVGRAAAR